MAAGLTMWCCENGQRLGVQVCPACSEASRGYQAAMRPVTTVLSIRQPWAWLIIHGGKDIENRSWSTRFRGRFWVHASQGMTRDEYLDGVQFAYDAGVSQIKLPRREELLRGQIIGAVDLVDCVSRSPSPWFCGRWGFVLANPQPVTPRPVKGRLGLFEEPPQ